MKNTYSYRVPGAGMACWAGLGLILQVHWASLQTVKQALPNEVVFRRGKNWMGGSIKSSSENSEAEESGEGRGVVTTLEFGFLLKAGNIIRMCFHCNPRCRDVRLLWTVLS